MNETNWNDVAFFIREANRDVQKYFIVPPGHTEFLNKFKHRYQVKYHKKRMCCFCENKIVATVQTVGNQYYGHLRKECNICNKGGFTIQTNGTCTEFINRRSKHL